MRLDLFLQHWRWLCVQTMDTPQLHDRDGGSDDDDDESGYGADRYDDDILYHMKDGGVFTDRVV